LTNFTQPSSLRSPVTAAGEPTRGTLKSALALLALLLLTLLVWQLLDQFKHTIADQRQRTVEYTSVLGEHLSLNMALVGQQALYRVTNGPLGKSLFAKLEPKGFRGLAYWDNGFKEMTANKPLHTPADFRGLKMRIQSSKVLDAQFRALGANPQVLAFSEVYQALQTGVVDGTENPPSNMYTQKMHEVQKHVTVSNHGYLGYAVIVNKKFWDGLPADVRGQLQQAMADATKYEKAIAQQDNDMAMDAIRKAGKTTIYNLNPQEQAAWRKALLPVQKQMEDRVGKDLIGQINKATASVQ